MRNVLVLLGLLLATFQICAVSPISMSPQNIADGDVLLGLNGGEGHIYWSETTLFDSGSDQLSCSHKSYQVQGDTIINSVSYLKCLLNGSYFGAIRTTADSLVYLIDQYNSTERLVYDFSWKVGKVLHFNVDDVQMDSFVITQIDSILLENGQKRATIQFIYGARWIQGVGSTEGFFTHVQPRPTCFCSNELVCYHANDVLLYKNTDYKSCDSCDKLNNAIIKTESSNEVIFVSEGPRVNLIWHKPFDYLCVYSLEGFLLLSKDITNMYDLSFNQENRGVYIIQFANSNGVNESYKFVH